MCKSNIYLYALKSTWLQSLPDDTDLVIGEFRSSCTSAIYSQVEKRNIPLLSYGSTAAIFSNKITYPYLFRTCPSDNHQAKALNEVVEKLKWDKLGVISTTNEYGSGLLKDVTDKLKAGDVRITAQKEFDPLNADRITKNILAVSWVSSVFFTEISNKKDNISFCDSNFHDIRSSSDNSLYYLVSCIYRTTMSVLKYNKKCSLFYCLSLYYLLYFYSIEHY